MKWGDIIMLKFQHSASRNADVIVQIAAGKMAANRIMPVRKFNISNESGRRVGTD